MINKLSNNCSLNSSLILSSNLDLSLCNGHHIDTSTLENMNTIPIKLSYILKINMELGIQNTCIAQSISREKIESLSNYFRKEVNNINISFGYTNNSKMNQFNFSNNLTLLKKMYKSWTNSSFDTIIDKHGKVIYCNFIPNSIFCQNDSYINPFHRDEKDKYKFTIIPTISDTLKEQITIENELLILENKRLKREQDRENERIEDEKQLILLKDRENRLDKKLQ